MYEYNAKIISVYDGDGVYDAEIDMGMNLFQRKDIRLFGVDTPEMRGEHKKAGKVVRDFVRNLILNKAVLIITQKDKTGKYGRLLASVIIDDIDLAQLLLDKGYAKAYHGGKKQEWSTIEIDHILLT